MKLNIKMKAILNKYSRKLLEKAKKPSPEYISGYTLVELLLTIFIMGIILTAVTLLLISLTKLTIKADARRQVRQDIESALEVIRRDLRNSDPALSLVDCDPNFSYELMGSELEEGNQLDLVLASGNEIIVYKTVIDPEGFTYIVRDYSRGGSNKTTEITSVNVNITTFDVKCNLLIKGNKMLTIDLGAASTVEKAEGEPIVEEVLKKTGVTIRNTDF